MRELEGAERIGNRSAWFYNNLAWLLSTADDDSIRDGKRAERAIEHAVELMPNEPAILDKKAAVSAELVSYFFDGQSPAQTDDVPD